MNNRVGFCPTTLLNKPLGVLMCNDCKRQLLRKTRMRRSAPGRGTDEKESGGKIEERGHGEGGR